MTKTDRNIMYIIRINNHYKSVVIDGVFINFTLPLSQSDISTKLYIYLIGL
jgi:hypothetical protein